MISSLMALYHYQDKWNDLTLKNFDWGSILNTCFTMDTCIELLQTTTVVAIDQVGATASILTRRAHAFIKVYNLHNSLYI